MVSQSPPRVSRPVRGALIDDDEGDMLARQLSRRAAAHPARAANNVVLREPADLALHFSPSEEAAQLEF